LERLSALLKSEIRNVAAVDGLEPVHALALWYLSRANRFSDHPLAVAEFLGLTKGNVSQRLNVMEAKGLIVRGKDTTDRRKVHLMLTKVGKAVLRRLYPPRSWVPEESPGLETALEGALRGLIAANGGRMFGVCRTCRHHEPRGTGAYCRLIQISLSGRQAGQICQEHELAEVGA
jgi:DNA-binding MarR family transcriptional regulator